MRITKVYTRTGDQGTTQLVGGAVARKDDVRIEAYGTVDELNAVLGVARQFVAELPEADRTRLDEVLARVQDDLFNVGTDLATPAEARWEAMHRVGDAEVTWLEQTLDGFNDELPPLTEFVLPGGGRAGAFLHQARTVARRAERRALAVCDVDPSLTDGALRYLNRLSDLLFVVSRWAAKSAGVPEVTWRNPSRWRR
jgi:cob(I)alamin adenosyltransferase